MAKDGFHSSSKSFKHEMLVTLFNICHLETKRAMNSNEFSEKRK